MAPCTLSNAALHSQAHQMQHCCCLKIWPVCLRCNHAVPQITAPNLIVCAHHREVQAVIDRESQPAPNSEPIKFPQQYAQSYFSQYLQLLKRLNSTYWRNVPYNGTRFVFGTVIALLMGCILWNIGTKRSTVQVGGELSRCLVSLSGPESAMTAFAVA